MLRVTIQYPGPGPAHDVAAQLVELANTIATGGKDQVVHQFGITPDGTYGLTVHVLPDPAAPPAPTD